MHRRYFLGTSFALAGGMFLGSPETHAKGADPLDCVFPIPHAEFRFAPHFGMFRNLAGDDLVGQLQFMADQGFIAVEDLRLRERPADVQNRLGRELERLGMHIGAFLATADFSHPTFASGDRHTQDFVLSEIQSALESARRVGAKCCIVVPGRGDRRLSPARQTANAVALMQRCSELCEPGGMTLLLEPLDRGPQSPPMFLRTLSQAHHLCRAVGSPACRILLDVYEQSGVQNDLLAAIDRVWDQIGYVQIADNPGRKEPGTGTIDFRGLFQHLQWKNYKGIIGLDHGNSQPGAAGERAVLAAYARPSRIPMV